MTDALTCPQCDAELPSNAPAGICPRCLMQAALADSSDENLSSADSPYAVTTPQPGSFLPPESGILAGQFPHLEILELLGQGGMGAVYKARQPKLDRMVALKVIRPESAADPTFAERFNREAKTLARLNHPNIVGVHDFGEVNVSGDGSGDLPKTLYYFLMEYVDGANLRQMMEREELKRDRALTIAPQICDALQFAHDEGIVHRDIKPENILIDSRGRVKIADFGLAKLASPSEQDFTLTGTHQVMGTPRYMAPEQMAGSRAVDHRADLYSLGVVFYEMLTGQIPAGHFSPPSQHAAIDVRLDDVVMKTLAQRPEDRFQTAREVRSSLEAIAQDEGGLLLSEPVAPEHTPAKGFSTIFEREVGAAWNWVVHPEKSKTAAEQTDSMIFPRLLFITLAVLGGCAMFLPWAEIHIDQDTVVSYVEQGAKLTAPVDQVYSGTSVWSSAAAGGLCFLMLFVLILIPHRRSPGFIVAGLLTMFSLASFIHTLTYQAQLQAEESVVLPLEVRGLAAVRQETLDKTGTWSSADAAATDSQEVASRIYGFPKHVSLRSQNLFEFVSYREGFYASLGFSLSLLMLSIISVRNAFLNREPQAEGSESWSGTPFASLRFQVPVKGDIGSKIKFHFLGMGYELADEQPGTWIFQRGTLMGGMMQEDIRAYPTRLSVHSIQEEDGGHLVNCHWSVRLMGGWAGKKDIRKLEDEGRELESLLRGSSSSSVTPVIEQTVNRFVEESPTPAAASSQPVADIVDEEESEGWIDTKKSHINLNRAEAEVSGPAITMMLVGILMMIGHGIFLVNAATGTFHDEIAWFATPGIFVGLAIFAGGFFLKGLKSRDWAYVGIIAGFLPVSPAWVLTMFVSIWANSVLSEPQVKMAFLHRHHRRRDKLKRVRTTKGGGIDFVTIEEELSGPSIALMTVGLLIALGHLTLFIFEMLQPYDREMAPLAIPGFLIGIGMLVGGLHMHQMWSRGWAQLGMIAGFIPASAGWLISIPLSIWVYRVLARQEVTKAFLERKRQRRGELNEVHSARKELDHTALEEDVNGPSLAMTIVGGLIAIGHTILFMFYFLNTYDEELAALAVPGFFAGIAMSVGGFLMRRFSTRGGVQLGIIAGMIPVNAGWLISLPICIWANTVFHRREVKQAFRESRRRQSQGSHQTTASASKSGLTNVPVGILVALLVWSAIVGIGGVATYSWLRGELSSTEIEDRRAGTLIPSSGAYQQIAVSTHGIGKSRFLFDEEDIERTQLEFQLSSLRDAYYGGGNGKLTVQLPDLGYTIGMRGVDDTKSSKGLTPDAIMEWMGTSGVDLNVEGVRQESLALFRIAEFAHQQPAHELVDPALFTVTPGEIRWHITQYEKWQHTRYCLYVWLAGLVMMVLVSVVISQQRSHNSNDFGLKFLALSGTMIGLAFVLYVLRGGSYTEPSRSRTSHATATAKQAPLSQNTPGLHRAAYEGDLGKIKEQLEGGVGVNDKDPIYGQTPVMFAAGQGHASLVATLILLGADVNERDKQGQTALMFAVQNQHEPVRKAIETLVEISKIEDSEERQEKLNSLPGIDKRLIEGVDIDVEDITIDPLAQDNSGESVLMKAVVTQNIAYLRDAEYDNQVAGLQDQQGWTALMHAISLNDPAYVNQIHELNRQRLFLDEDSQVFVSDYTANPMFDPRALSRTDKQGLTALQLAEKQGRRKGDPRIPADKLIRDDMQQLIEIVSRDLESAELKPNLQKPLLEIRGHAYLALGEKDKAEADFRQAKEPVTN